MLPLAVALNPPGPKLTLPNSNGVLSAIVAPAPARPTAPLNVFDAFARVVALVPESIVAAPATVSGPFCVIPPVSLRAVRLPPTIVDPRFNAPAESAKRLPAVFTVPRVRAFASVILTDPGTAPPAPEPDALTGPWKSLPEFVSSMLEFAPFAVKPAGPVTSMVAPLAWVMLPFDVASKPPDPTDILPRVSGVLSEIVAPIDDTPTAPPKALLALASDTLPLSADRFEPPPTAMGPVCVMSPVVLTAFRSLAGLVIVRLPRFRAPPEVAVTSPVPVIVARPRSVVPVLVVVREPPIDDVPMTKSPPSALGARLPVVVTVPSVRPPVPSTSVTSSPALTLTGPTKLLPVPDNVMSAGDPFAVAANVVMPPALIAELAACVIEPPVLVTLSEPVSFTLAS